MGLPTLVSAREREIRQQQLQILLGQQHHPQLMGNTIVPTAASMLRPPASGYASFPTSNPGLFSTATPPGLPQMQQGHHPLHDQSLVAPPTASTPANMRLSSNSLSQGEQQHQQAMLLLQQQHQHQRYQLQAMLLLQQQQQLLHRQRQHIQMLGGNGDILATGTGLQLQQHTPNFSHAARTNPGTGTTGVSATVLPSATAAAAVTYGAAAAASSLPSATEAAAAESRRPHSRFVPVSTSVGPGAYFVAKKRRRYDQESFPQKLHRMLLQVEEDGLSDVVSFAPSGTAFDVIDVNRFVEEVLPQYFKHKKITSFRRQLSMYGFRRLRDGPEKGAYAHQQFTRAHTRKQLGQMKRVSELELVLPEGIATNISADAAAGAPVSKPN